MQFTKNINRERQISRDAELRLVTIEALELDVLCLAPFGDEGASRAQAVQSSTSGC